MVKRSDTNVVIFDFDGTLADVVPILRDLYDDIGEKRGYPKLTEAKFQELRRGTAKDVMKWAKIRPWQLPKIMSEGRKLFRLRIAEVKLFDGIKELVNRLDKEGWDIYVLSSNSVATIHEVLARYGIAGSVHIMKRPPLFGKASSINALVRKKRYDRKSVWMIGDEVRDIEAANKAGVNSVAVAWGLQHEVALKKARPSHIALAVSDLKEFLKGDQIRAQNR